MKTPFIVERRPTIKTINKKTKKWAGWGIEGDDYSGRTFKQKARAQITCVNMNYAFWIGKYGIKKGTKIFFKWLNSI